MKLCDAISIREFLQSRPCQMSFHRGTSGGTLKHYLLLGYKVISVNWIMINPLTPNMLAKVCLRRQMALVLL